MKQRSTEDQKRSFCICQSKCLLFQVCSSRNLLDELIQLQFNSSQVSYSPWKAVCKDQPSVSQNGLFVPSIYQLVLPMNLTFTSFVVFTLLGAAGSFLSSLCFREHHANSLGQYSSCVV